MIAKGPAARPERIPAYSGQLVKVTGEGEQLTLAFTADTAEELMHRVAVVGDAASTRVAGNNKVILDAAGTFAERQAAVYRQAAAQLRKELGLPDPEEDATRADHPAGAVHAAENP